MDVWQDIQYKWTNSLDKRVIDMPLIASSYHVPLIILTYVYLVLFCGPRFMKNRPAYSLKTFIQVYNIVQIVINAWLLYGFIDAGFIARKNLICPELDYSDNETSRKVIRCGWVYMMLKILDYVETIVFILRKKDSQVSFLHLYHHTSTLFLAWVTVKYFATIPCLYPIMINTFIHVLMYTYYFLAACGPAVQRKIKNYKRILTLMQMGQFILIGLYISQDFLPGCKQVTYDLAVMVMANVVINFYLFYNFYQKTYVQKKSSKKAQ